MPRRLPLIAMNLGRSVQTQCKVSPRKSPRLIRSVVHCALCTGRCRGFHHSRKSRMSTEPGQRSSCQQDWRHGSPVSCFLVGDCLTRITHQRGSGRRLSPSSACPAYIRQCLELWTLVEVVETDIHRCELRDPRVGGAQTAGRRWGP